MSCTTLNDLPDGLVAEILSRLPVKTVIKSICVRKEWRSLIKSSYFVSLHLSRNSVLHPPNSYILLVHNPSIALFEFGLIPDTTTTHVTTDPFPDKFDIQFKNGNDSNEIRGACKGLVCLTNSNHADRCIYLINPFIRKCKTLQVDSSCYPNLIHGNNVGISFGYSDNDYKVLRIIRVLGTKRKRCDNNNSGRYFVEIYSLKSGKWKIVDFSMEIELPVSGKATYAHGCLYWCVNEGKNSHLLCFSLKDEVFSQILLPKTYLKLYSRRSSGIFNKNDSVVVVLYNEPRYEKIKITLLVMEKNFDGHVQWEEFTYSDSEKVVLSDSDNEEDSDNEDEDDMVCPLGFSGDGRFIFETSCRKTYRKERYIVSLDLDNSCAMEKLEFRFDTKLQIESGWPEDIDNNDGVTNVMESLVLLSDESVD